MSERINCHNEDDDNDDYRNDRYDDMDYGEADGLNNHTYGLDDDSHAGPPAGHPKELLPQTRKLYLGYVKTLHRELAKSNPVEFATRTIEPGVNRPTGPARHDPLCVRR